MIKGVIFDLDGTLYDSDQMDKANKHAIVRAIAKHRGVDLSEALTVLESAVGNYSQAGGRPSIYGTALNLGVPDSLIEEMQNEEVQPAFILSADPELARKISDLSKKARLALMTNTRTSIAREAISALGISLEAFVIVRGGDELVQPKPSSADLLEICEKLGIAPGECISVGDRWNVDLAPAKAIGMKTKEVDGRDDLSAWISEILA